MKFFGFCGTRPLHIANLVWSQISETAFPQRNVNFNLFTDWLSLFETLFEEPSAPFSFYAGRKLTLTFLILLRKALAQRS